MMAIADVKARKKAEAGPAAAPSNVPGDTDDFIGKARKQVVSDRLKTMQTDTEVIAERQRSVALATAHQQMLQQLRCQELPVQVVL